MEENRNSIDPLIAKIVEMAPIVRLILGDECVFTISDKAHHLHVNQGTRLKLPIKDGSEIKEGSATYGCVTTGKPSSYKVDAKVYGVAYIGKAFPIRDASGNMVGSINLGIPIDIQEKVVRMAGDLESSLHRIGDVAIGLTDASGGLSDSVQKLMLATASVEGSIKKMYTIARLLTDISSNTKVLGINAAIQAAHAGEAGAGFSVVSHEIRSLAGKARDSVKDIERNITEIIAAIEQFGLESKELSKISMLQKGLTEQISGSMGALSEMSQNLSKIAEELVAH